MTEPTTLCKIYRDDLRYLIRKRGGGELEDKLHAILQEHRYGNKFLLAGGPPK